MIFFNWEQILRRSKNDCNVALNVLKCISRVRKPNPLENRIMLKSMQHPQHNWIEHPVELFYSKATTLEICTYVSVASKRNYFSYLNKRITYLPTYVFNDEQINKLKLNTLLLIENNKIYFKY